MGLIAAIIGWLQYHLGLRTDASSSTGSLHAKVGSLKDTVNTQCDAKISTRQAPRGVHGTPGSFISNQTTYQTALSVTGKGRLTYLRVKNGSSVNGNIQIVIDGNVVAAGKFLTNSAYHYPLPDFVFSPTVSTGIVFGAAGNAEVNLSYKSSLQIQVYSDTSAGIWVDWQYEHE